MAKAFGSVQRTAVEAAVGQAALRRGVSQVFLNLARRKQGLLHRQLALLDCMQRRAHDPDSLEDLFRLDHLTTRMRRHAESLIILSGAAPGRAWRKPVPVVDIVRAAVAEVEDYTRVDVETCPAAPSTARAAADLTHLVAELVENATIFSPPHTTVQRARRPGGQRLRDRGGGPRARPAAEEYAALNARLANPPEFDLADSDRLGLFVVASWPPGTASSAAAPLALRRHHGHRVPARRAHHRPGRTPRRARGIGRAAARTRKKALAVVSGGTHAGLPRRVRQANLSSRLKDGAPPSRSLSGPTNALR